MTGFEPAASWSQTKHSSKLNYIRIHKKYIHFTCVVGEQFPIWVVHPQQRMEKRLKILVPVTGVEPVRCCHQRILSPSRLPIPSHRHIFKTLGTTTQVRTGDLSGMNRTLLPTELLWHFIAYLRTCNLGRTFVPFPGFRRYARLQVCPYSGTV